MKYIRGGEVLSSPVYTEEKNILLPKGTVLKSEYKDLLTSLNIESVEIEDPYYSYQNSNLIISEEKQNEYEQEIRKLLENHLYIGKESLREVVKLAQKIISYINSMDLGRVYDIPYQKPNLYKHTFLVTALSLMVAKKMQVSENDLSNIAIGCLLHDLGLRYITVPYLERQLDEASPADLFEYKKHTILAYTVLEGERDWLPDKSKNMILSHHEKMNGSGFPLKQKEQEMECKILQLCDTFECLVSGMECRHCSIEKTIDYLWSQAGKRYEKKLMEVLFSMVAKYPVGTQVELSNQKYGIVSRQTHDPERPMVLGLTKIDGEAIPEEMYNLEENTHIHITRII